MDFQQVAALCGERNWKQRPTRWRGGATRPVLAVGHQRVVRFGSPFAPADYRPLPRGTSRCSPGDARCATGEGYRDQRSLRDVLARAGSGPLPSRAGFWREKSLSRWRLDANRLALDDGGRGPQRLSRRGSRARASRPPAEIDSAGPASRGFIGALGTAAESPRGQLMHTTRMSRTHVKLPMDFRGSRL